ncbi:MAG: hypothetical protein WDN28_01145 [Chthoniobacter sp.]
MKELVATGFQGTLVLEMAGTPDPNTTLANARRGRSYLRKVARQLALRDAR